jgi:hypothetical protein
MRRRVAVLLMLCLVAVFWGLIGASASGASSVTVKPPSGSPTTRFVVSFQAPQSAGRTGVSERRYTVEVHGGGNGCSTTGSSTIKRAKAHHRVNVTLVPSSSGWCPGTYAGQVNETQQPACAKGQVCPMFVKLLKRIGRFTFRVTRATGASDMSPPTFAGLQSATACTPGPQRPGQTTPFTLTWNAATDNVTPSSAIVYDVYVASIPGSEDFSKPTWTTMPGMTTYRTAGLASHGTFYFVVRARDQAGNEDQNKVERRGVDPCL